MQRFSPTALLAFVLVLLGCSDKDNGPTGPPAFNGGLDLQLVVGGLDDPVFVTAPPGDSRLFIVERTGAIRIFKNGSLLSTPFLSVAGQLAQADVEQGLLGLAFDPQYASNGRFYVALTANNGEQQIRRYQVSPNPDVAGNGVNILTWNDTAPNHNGGMLEFGPDGMLYVSVGDGGEQGDPFERGQSTNDLFGSILRLDVETGTVQIPPDNPYPNPPARPEIWNIGLRNPWRFSFDRATGDLYIADVGYGSREEINVSPAPNRGRAVNYGWDTIEGTDCFEPDNNCVTTGLTPPVLEYPHSQGCCVIGGFVYRGTQLAGLQGTYFYADHCQHWVRSFYYANGAVSQERSWTGLDPGDAVTSFGQDAFGELYVCTENTGNVYRIVAAPTVAAR